jgi:phosphomannomutase
MPIKFGTDGWRDTMDTDFTVANVERVAQAYIDYYAETGNAAKGFFVGYDNREHSEVFARHTAEIISGNGFPVKLSDKSCPTQVVSFMVQQHRLCSGVMITASHNPPQYNGFKVKEPQGCSSFPETTDGIMAFLDKNNIKKSAALITISDPKPEYFDYIEKRIHFQKIKSAGIHIFINPLFGSAAGYIPELLAKHTIACTEINNSRDTHFGGFNPEPLAYNVPDFMEKIRLSKQDFALGVIMDGDGDRNGACGTHGDFINSQKVFSVLFHHFAENLKKPGKLVHAFNGTKLLDKLAAAIGREVIVSKIGFKYIAEEILKGGVLIGGEESGGYSASGNIPDRDGILNSLYLLEVMAHEHKTVDQIYADLEKRFGTHCYDRLDLHVENRVKDAAIGALQVGIPKRIGNKPIVRFEELDGIKVHFADDSWILFRASGTEPLLRIYCEAAAEKEVQEMLTHAKAFVTGVA